MGKHNQVYFDVLKQMHVKRCARCGEHRNLEEFYRKKNSKYFQPYCRSCTAEVGREAYAKHYRKPTDKEGVFDTRRGMIYKARERAKAYGLPFNIKREDLPIQEYCPALSLKLDYASNTLIGASPSIDRIIPAKGYVKGNVDVISARANGLKNDLSLEQLEAKAAKVRARLAELEGIIRYVGNHLASQTEGEP